MEHTSVIRERPSSFIHTARNADMHQLITPKLFSPEELLNMREQFYRSGYIKLPSFLSEDALAIFQEEMRDLELIASRKKFDMPGYETPRKLSVAGGNLIKTHSPTLFGLYHHYALRSNVEQLTGRRIYSCTHPEEFMVANFLHHNGDTHGWHLDDPAFALIIFAESPQENAGGEVEFISNWPDICKRKRCQPDSNIQELIAWAEENGMVDRHAHNCGDAYLLRADLNLHRVCPLKYSGERRSVVNLAFQTKSEVDYGLTANLLYG